MSRAPVSAALSARCQDLRVGHSCWGADAHVHAHLAAHHHQRVAHVEAASPGSSRRSGSRLVAVLDHRQEIGQHLGGVPLVGQAVLHRHAGVRREVFDGRLAEPRYSIPSNMRPNTRAVSFIDSLWPICEPRIQVGDVGALVVGRHLERAACTGRGLLEDQGDDPAGQPMALTPGSAVGLQPRRRGRSASRARRR